MNTLQNYFEMNRLFNLDGKDLRIVPFSSLHLKVMNLKPVDLQIINTHEDYFSYIERTNDYGYNYTFMANDTPLNCWGVIPYWKGVAEFWMIPDKALPKHKFRFHRGSLKFFDLVQQRLRLHRLQCSVSSRNVLAHKWIKSMYFKSEGIMEKFGTDKSNWEMYSRVY